VARFSSPSKAKPSSRSQALTHSEDTSRITHFPNISGALPQAASGLSDGEALVFQPDGKGGAVLVARVKIEEWPHIGS